MALPTYNPEQIYALARVLAEAALDDLMSEMAADFKSSVSEPTKDERRVPDQGNRAVLRGFDRSESRPIRVP